MDDGFSPFITCFTKEQARSEALSALAACALTPDQREDCFRTLDLIVEDDCKNNEGAFA